MFEWLFLAVPWGCLRFVIVVFPDHTHLLFFFTISVEGIYFAVEMGIITVSCVQAVVVLNLFYRGTSGRNVPHWLKTILFGGLGKLFCFQWDKRHQTDEFIDKNIGNNVSGIAFKLRSYAREHDHLMSQSGLATTGKYSIQDIATTNNEWLANHFVMSFQ